MNRAERVLYHQIHPAKLATDVATAALAVWLFWRHRLWIALIVGFVPSVLVTAYLMRWANLEPYRRSRFGRYLARFMTPRVEAARFAGLIPLWVGAWIREPIAIVAGAVWIAACWLWGLRPAEREAA